MPSEYLPVIQSGETDDGDLTFDNMEEANRFMALVSQHWNQVNHQLNEEAVYLPLVLGDERGNHQGSNDWAKGFITGTHLRHEIWLELIDDEECLFVARPPARVGRDRGVRIAHRQLAHRDRVIRDFGSKRPAQ